MGKLQFMHESCLYGAFCVAEGCHDRFRAEKYQFTCAPDLDLSLAALLLWLGVCVCVLVCLTTTAHVGWPQF